jgi:outer membrane protein assembly factor BamA
MKPLIRILMLVVPSLGVYAQNKDTSNVKKECPFFIHPSKRMSEDELIHKKEGYFVTGLPEIERNPINGLGIGGNIYLYNNKTKDDPFFACTPYRARYAGFFKVFQSGKWNGAINMDFPYLFNSRWRMRIDAVFENDPNFQYYGFGTNTMRPLRFRDKAAGIDREYNQINSYLDNLAIVRAGNSAIGEAALVTDRHYNEVDYTENLYNILGERIFAGGRGRLMFGYELLYIKIRDYFNREAEEAFDADGNEVKGVFNGRTRLTEDYLGISPGSPWQKYNIAGYNGGREGIVAFAIMYDTRDFEPDPTKGFLIEYSHEHSRPWLFSQFSFDKNLIQGAYFCRLFPSKISRMVLAINGDIGYIWGSKIPFYEAFDLSSQAEAGGTEVLGGARSLRGFREYRFVGPLTALLNVEIRTRIVQKHLFKQHFAFDVMPFFDTGRIWNEIKEFNFRDYRYSYGFGLRLAWNQSTILRADWAFSKESAQFFFGFGHIF